jgi:hypothetical protein
MTYRLETTTDAEGKFSFDKVPPGDCVVSRQYRTPVIFVSSHKANLMVRAGETTEVALGGSGRSIVGKAMMPDGTGSTDWQKVSVRLRSKTGNEPGARPKREDFPAVQDYIAANERYFRFYRDQQHFSTVCEGDGSFRISDVPVGSYELAIEVRDSKQNSVTPHDISDPSPVVASLGHEVVVPDGQGSEAIDLGTLELVAKQANAAGQ